jgi:hypothetical protein
MILIIQAFKLAAAYEVFWNYTRLASRLIQYEDTIEAQVWHQKLLDIHPEGELMRETNDILDELNIIQDLKSLQKRVTELFVKNIKEIWEKQCQVSDPSKSNKGPKGKEIQNGNDTAILSATIGHNPDETYNLEGKVAPDTMSPTQKMSKAAMDDLLTGIEYHLTELKGLQSAAQQNWESVRLSSAFYIF